MCIFNKFSHLPKLPFTKVQWEVDEKTLDTHLCPYDCIHKKYIQSRNGVVTKFSPSEPGWHFCDKNMKILRRPFGGTNETLPFKECGEEVNINYFLEL